MQLNITWVPRDANVIADEVSKFVDYDDWTTSDAFFYAHQQGMGAIHD